MRGRTVPLLALAAATALCIVLLERSAPAPQPVWRMPEPQLVFADPGVEQQMRRLCGHWRLTAADALQWKEATALTLMSGWGDTGLIASLTDLPIYYPNLKALVLDFWNQPMTLALWNEIAELPLKRLGVSACGGFEEMVLPEDLERLACNASRNLSGENRLPQTLPHGLLLSQGAFPLEGKPVQYYLYLQEGTAVELVQTDLWQEAGELWGGWETQLRISQRAGDRWELQACHEILERPNADDGVAFADVNFDGRTDLLVMLGHFGAQGAVAYTAFLQRDGGFVEEPSFSGIANPANDVENRLILSTWRNWAASHSWAEYEYRNGSYVEIRRLTEEPAPDSPYEPEDAATWQYIVEELQNGQWATMEVWRCSEHTGQETADRFLTRPVIGESGPTAGARSTTMVSWLTGACMPVKQWGVCSHETFTQVLA